MTVKKEKEEDLYEMAIQYRKDEDFSGWYTDVSSIRSPMSPRSYGKKGSAHS